MKIAIPVKDKNLELNVFDSFGRAPYFLIYNTESEEKDFLENTAVMSAGGAGIKAAQIIVDSKADALLTPRCGVNAADVLENASIKIYKTNDVSIKDNIDAFTQNKLVLLNEIHSGFHGQRGN